MEIALKPQEYYYLYSPLRADPVEMLKYTVQSLVLEGHVAIDYKLIYITSNNKDQRYRIFFKIGDQFKETNKYSVAENFVLDVLKTQEELRLFEFKNQLLEFLHDDIKNFKSNYVYEDVKGLGLCYNKFLLNGKGRKARNAYSELIELIESKTDELLKNDASLEAYLTELSTGIILLDDIVVTKLKKTVPNLDELSAAFEILRGAGSDGGGGGTYSGGGGSSGGGGFGGFGAYRTHRPSLSQVTWPPS